jgi:hypothetical protein
MNINAANALLKSLEEPSGDTVLLLVSHQPSRLLPTIKSRCVQQACPLPSEAMSLQWLAKGAAGVLRRGAYRIADPGGRFAIGGGQSAGSGRARAACAGGRWREEAAQAAAIADPTGRSLESIPLLRCSTGSATGRA